MTCPHVAGLRPVPPRTPDGCEECLKIGSPWVHLRLCLSCGHVGCCDSSPNRHASRHYQKVGHPIAASHEPGESWAWCYVDETELEVPASALGYLRR
jgi:uncharacterized UBP type Zn finger protein